MKVVVDGQEWEIRWRHEPYRAKLKAYVARDEAGTEVVAHKEIPLPRGTDCAVFMGGELMAAAHVAPFRRDPSRFWDKVGTSGDQFSRAQGRKQSLRKALSAIQSSIDKTITIECIVPRPVRAAIWDEYHRQWPFDPLDLAFREMARLAALDRQPAASPTTVTHSQVEALVEEALREEQPPSQEA